MATRKKPRKSAFRTLREFSAGGLIWRWQNPGGRPEVVLVKPTGRNTWVLPKGGLESKETVEQAAMRECREETGFMVSIDQPLGQVAYFYARRESPNGPLYRIFKRVSFFLMKPSGGRRQPARRRNSGREMVRDRRRRAQGQSSQRARSDHQGQGFAGRARRRRQPGLNCGRRGRARSWESFHCRLRKDLRLQLSKRSRRLADYHQHHGRFIIHAMGHANLQAAVQGLGISRGEMARGALAAQRHHPEHA